jgi:hypothetical protein
MPDLIAWGTLAALAVLILGTVALDSRRAIRRRLRERRWRKMLDRGTLYEHAIRRGGRAGW